MVVELIEGLRNSSYTLCAILICRKFPNTVSDSSGGFEYSTTVVWYNSDINLSTQASAPGSISYETTSLRQNLLGH
jgi:hypothetical protein